MKRVLPPTYFLIALLLMLACHVLVLVYRVVLFPWTLLGLIPLEVFRFSRNPMYLGMVCILAGVAGLTGALTPWLVIPVFMVVFARVFIQVEEAMLEETFGEAYQAYKRRVRRWL